MSRHFPDILHAYLKYTSGHESTERIRKWSFISVLAGCLERRVYLPRGHYTLFPNLYVFLIGRSGLIKKTTSSGIAVNLLREVEGVRIMAERLTANALIEQFQLSGKVYEHGGKRINQSALYAYASELSVFLVEVFGSITELLTTFYDCLPHDSSKPWVYHTIKRDERKIYGPCLNILGASTKAWLKKCIPSSEMEGGFTSRIVFVVENKLPEKLIAWPELSDADNLDRLRLIEDMRHIFTLCGKVEVTPDAKAMFTRWYEHHMKKVLPRNNDPRMSGYLSRKGDTILKLAIIRSVSLRSDLVLTKQDLVWANDEIDALEIDWKMAFDGMSNVSSLTYKINDFVAKKTIVRKSELISYFAQMYPANEILKSIAELKGMEEIVDVEKLHEGKRLEYYAMPGYAEMIELEK